MSICVHAIVVRSTRLPRLPGAPGRPLRLVRGTGAAAVVSEVVAAWAPTPAALRAHDRIVRQIARRLPAVLPVRFGSTFADDRDVARALGSERADWRKALRDVTCREQMTLRLFGEGVAAAATAAPRRRRTARSGTAYLRERAEALARSQRAPELDPLRPLLGPLVAAERVRRHDRGPLILTAHHLIARGRAAAYRRALAEGARRSSLRILATGPWPPYAFVPELAE
jgi:Gas vesicle synthesis protein GvpL/GvpF